MLANAIVLHLIADWIFQNDWIARNKTNLRHGGAWIHLLIHFIAMSIVFHPLSAAIIALSHMMIDTRKPVIWWQRVFRQTTDGDYAIHVSIWLDQVFHISIIAAMVAITGGTK